jgi:hypothetical protein
VLIINTSSPTYAGYTLLSPTERAWLASAVDGEGAVMLIRRDRGGLPNWVPTVTVTNTDLGYATHAADLFYKACGSGGPYASDRGPGYRRVYRAQVTGLRACAALLPLIAPDLIIKREKAEALVAWSLARAKLPRSAPYGAETEAALRVLRAGGRHGGEGRLHAHD